SRLRSILQSDADAGTYSGELDEGANVGSFGIGLPARTFIRGVIEQIGHLFQIGTTVFAPLAVWTAIRRHQPAWAFVLLPIAYVYASNSVAVLQARYLSSLILLQVLVCAHGADIALSALGSLSLRACSTTAAAALRIE